MIRRHRTLLSLLAVTLLLAFGVRAYYVHAAIPAASTPSTVKTAKVGRGDLIVSSSGTGTLVAQTSAALGFRSAGRLVELTVDVGQRVQAGQVVARLDSRDAALQVAQAETNLRLAELKLAQLQDPDASTVAAAKYTLAAAQADLARLTTPPTAQEVAAARDNVTAAQEALNALLSGATADEVTVAKADMKKAETTLQAAQADYDTVSWRGDVGALPQSAALQNATIEYEKAKANYALKVAPPTKDQVAAAKGKLAQAQSTLDTLQRGPTPEDLAAARAKVAQAEAVLAGASNTDVEIARLQVDLARNSLQSAQAQLADTELRAPFAGAVTAIKAAAGEWVSAGPVLTLADLDHIQVDFYLDESEMAGLAVGYPVEIVLDALPDASFAGRVTQLVPSIETVEGVPVARAIAELDPPKESRTLPLTLVGGMDATVEVIAAERRNVVLVPIAAVRELAPGQAIVFVVGADGQLTMRSVQVGAKDLVNAEIISGLEPGDVVSTGMVDTGSKGA